MLVIAFLAACATLLNAGYTRLRGVEVHPQDDKPGVQSSEFAPGLMCFTPHANHAELLRHRAA